MYNKFQNIIDRIKQPKLLNIQNKVLIETELQGFLGYPEGIISRVQMKYSNSKEHEEQKKNSSVSFSALIFYQT